MRWQELFTGFKKLFQKQRYCPNCQLEMKELWGYHDFSSGWHMLRQCTTCSAYWSSGWPEGIRRVPNVRVELWLNPDIHEIISSFLGEEEINEEKLESMVIDLIKAMVDEKLSIDFVIRELLMLGQPALLYMEKALQEENFTSFHLEIQKVIQDIKAGKKQALFKKVLPYFEKMRQEEAYQRAHAKINKLVEKYGIS